MSRLVWNMNADRPMCRNERHVFGATLALIGLLVLALNGCASLFHTPKPERTPAQQYTAAVVVKVTCMGKAGLMALHVQFGTGVLISANHVLTAAHVVTCDIAQGETLFGLTIVMPNGSDEYIAEPEFLYLKRDVVRLRLPYTDVADVPPVHLGPKPSVGDVVCAATAMPQYTYRCERAQPPIADPDVFLFGAYIQHGNSGSAVYDAQGRLIGLVVDMRRCQGDFPCLSGIAPLQDLSQLFD